MVTNARWDVQLPLKEVITPTQFADIDVVPSNLNLGKLESELLAERDSQDLPYR